MRNSGTYLPALLAAGIAALCLAFNVTAYLERIPEPFFDHLPPRFWQDVHIAEAFYFFGEFPAALNQVMKRRDGDGVIRTYEAHPHLSRAAQEAGNPPWRFWEVVRENRFRRSPERTLVDRFDDSGRPLLLGLGFKALGGISPYLMFWMGALVAWPLCAWIACEFAGVGRPVAGMTFVLTLGFMPFFADSLALPYSTVGFHVIAVLVTVPLSVHAVLAPQIERRAWLPRVLAGGLFLAVCVLARGGAALTLAGPLAALTIAATRAGRQRGRRADFLLLCASLVVLALPYLGARVAVDRLIALTAAAYGRASVAPQRHAFWFGMWTGLGDHDRTKGYQWLDASASAAVVAAGGSPLRSDRYDPANEAIFRRLILTDVEADPVWYARILLKRLWSTMALVKLWPWRPLSGRSIAPATHPNEGVIDSYYSLATPADRWGIGDCLVEWPIPLLVTPSLVILFLAWRRGGSSSYGKAAALLAILAAAVLPLPLLVGTGGAIEPQCFVIVHCLALVILAGHAPSRDDSPAEPGLCSSMRAPMQT